MDKFSIRKSIIIQAKPEQVFDALTSSEEIPKYFPVEEVISTWIEGAEVLYKGTVNGQAFTDYGRIEKLKPPHIYEYRYWSTNHGSENLPENHLVISYQLSNDNQATKLVLEQRHISSADMYEMMNNHVWDALLQALKHYVEAKPA
ncbi:MAG: SRPBCC domain-containing protein [Gammaproteobacteria bacterium]|nr:SRPBCC domain-containing protein [Gammaproteobacteria bacterium]